MLHIIEERIGTSSIANMKLELVLAHLYAKIQDPPFVNEFEHQKHDQRQQLWQEYTRIRQALATNEHTQRMIQIEIEALALQSHTHHLTMKSLDQEKRHLIHKLKIAKQNMHKIVIHCQTVDQSAEAISQHMLEHLYFQIVVHEIKNDIDKIEKHIEKLCDAMKAVKNQYHRCIQDAQQLIMHNAVFNLQLARLERALQ